MEWHATVLLDGLAFPEGLRWRGDTLWFSDMHAQTVLAVGLTGEVRHVATVPAQPSGLGWLPDGRLLVMAMHDRRLLRLDPEGLVEHADLRGIATGICNDMVVDARGRAYVGNFGPDPDAVPDPARQTAALALVDPDGTVRVAATGLLFPNGAVITPDGRTLIVAESAGQRLTAFDVAADGALLNRRAWAETKDVWPDGLCLDADGAVWVANAGKPECLRLAEGGAVLDRVTTSQRCFACALGGTDGTTLLIATAPSADPVATLAARTGRIELASVVRPGTGSP